jgi:septal ring factor EnvC (AmiA/AmiB activator)
MSEVQRYAVIETALCIGGNLHEGEVFMVRADEHYRELSALREELASTKNGYKWESERAALLLEALNNCEAELAAAEQRNADLQKRWDSTNSALQRRNILNERMQDRLDERDALLRAALPAVKYESSRGDDAGQQYIALAEKIDAALKPTESGASE